MHQPDYVLYRSIQISPADIIPDGQDKTDIAKHILTIIGHILLLERAAAASLATCAVPVAPPLTTTAVAVQLDPHAYPPGQHPPPWPAAQLNHPDAHPFWPNAASVSPVGTATVTPSLVKAIVEEAAGQDVRPQSRPTWQQPAW